MIAKAIAVVLWILFVQIIVGLMIIGWVRYPACDTGHVAAWAGPATMTTWVCVQGYSPPWRGHS